MSHTRTEKDTERHAKRREQYKKHKPHHREPTTYPGAKAPPNNPERETEEKEHIHHTRSEAYTDANRFFHTNSLESRGATQTTNVTVNINEKQDDCMKSGCAGLASCFGKSK